MNKIHKVIKSSRGFVNFIWRRKSLIGLYIYNKNIYNYIYIYTYLSVFSFAFRRAAGRYPPGICELYIFFVRSVCAARTSIAAKVPERAYNYIRNYSTEEAKFQIQKYGVQTRARLAAAFGVEE